MTNTPSPKVAIAETALKTSTEDFTRERAREVLEAYRHLRSNIAFRHLIGTFQLEYDTRMRELLSTPLSSYDQVLAQEYTKGECASLLIFTLLPANIEEYLESLIRPEDDEDEPEDSTE